jgi:hypothetical protein
MTKGVKGNFARAQDELHLGPQFFSTGIVVDGKPNDNMAALWRRRSTPGSGGNPL